MGIGAATRTARLAAAAAALIWFAAVARAGDLPDGPFNAPALYPEGPVFIAGALYYAEMTAERVVRWDAGGPEPFVTFDDCGPTSVSPFGDGDLAVTCHQADAIAIVSAEGELKRRIEHSAKRERLTLPNDSHSDRKGGVYFSSSGPFTPLAQPAGRIFHLRADGSVHLVAGGLHYSNGIFVTADAVLYACEHLARRILRYRIREDGSLEPLGVFADVAKLMPELRSAPRTTGPDGLEVTAGGSVFVAIYGSSRILHISPLGTLRRSYDTGLKFVTSLALDLDGNRMVVTGAHSNTIPPFKGEVRQIGLAE